MNEADTALLSEMRRGAELILDNAESLFKEAELLGMNGYFARAASLHQLSMEECSKLDLLGFNALWMAIGHSLDLKKVMREMSKHEVKNFNNAYFSLTTDEERVARRRGDFKKADEIFKAQQREIHTWLNDVKNGGLYVDYIQGQFVAPKERITEEVAAVMQGLNAFFLEHARTHMKVLGRLQDEQDVMLARVRALMSKMKALQGLPPDKAVESFYENYDSWVIEQMKLAREEPES